MRLTTNAPLSYIVNEITFPLTRPLTLIFGQDEPFLTGIDATCRDFLERTRQHWLDWSRNLAVPFEWQSAVIRAAITLKLTSFIETGAIVAAHTTSIPEAPQSTRNWDYRFCWLRDAYFVVDALNRLGATQIMESYINYIMTIATDPSRIQPVHGIVPFSSLEESVAPDLKGFLGHGPVRVGNQAALQIQNDVYGSVVLAATQMFVDERLPIVGDESLYPAAGETGRAGAVAGVRARRGPVGISRTRARPHLFGHPVLGRLRPARPDRAPARNRRPRKYWQAHAHGLRERILSEAWDEKQGALTGAFGAPDLDASVLLVSELGLLPSNDPRFVKTCEAIGRDLMRKGRIMRYVAPDDFGAPETALSGVQLLVHRRAPPDRADRGGAPPVRIDPRQPQRLRAPVGGHSSGDGGALGQSAADLFHGGHHQYRDAIIVELGGRMGPRLIIVSNRVAVPDPPGAPLAGGMAVAVKAALKNRTGMWFGWSGAVTDEPTGEPRIVELNKVTYVLIDLSKTDIQEYYNGLANSVLWPILHYRVDLQEYSRADASGYMRVNRLFADRLSALRGVPRRTTS